eukprot:scaffold3867_cov160-Isochrysis_galbana.AAC.3
MAEIVLSARLSLSASSVVVLRLCSPSQRRTQQSTDLSHRPIGVVGCARLWHALAGATMGRFPVVPDWRSGHTGSKVVALWLTLLSDDGSRGRLGDGGVSVAMSVGAEAEGAARASAGVCSMLNAKPKIEEAKTGQGVTDGDRDIAANSRHAKSGVYDNGKAHGASRWRFTAAVVAPELEEWGTGARRPQHSRTCHP